mgnify:CR=1 FL=1
MLNHTLKTKLENLKLAEIPEECGVYIFWDSENSPIYVGKSVNLKSRVRSYFLKSVVGKTKRMVSNAFYFSKVPVNSEIEALLLEAKLVRKLQPKFNAALKDDKHPLYIKITREKYPKVLTARKETEKDGYYFGPYPNSGNVRRILYLLRRIFPFSTHKEGRRACLYNQIGLCNPCPSNIEKEVNPMKKDLLSKIYRKNIKMIRLFLSGRVTEVKKALEKEIRKMGQSEDYETAMLIREKIKSIDYITQPITPVDAFIENPLFLEDVRHKELLTLKNLLIPHIKLDKNIKRIECFDIAHISGKFPTASMVTFVAGDAEKNLYRHFRIDKGSGGNDIASLREVAKRRLSHLDSWGVPDLVVVDGGRGQLAVFLEEFKDTAIPVVALAKRYETLIVANKKKVRYEFVEIRVPRGPALYLLQRIRNEAHRFARRYHHKLFQKNLFQTL